MKAPVRNVLKMANVTLSLSITHDKSLKYSQISDKRIQKILILR